TDVYAIELARAPAPGTKVKVTIKPTDSAVFLTSTDPVYAGPNRFVTDSAGLSDTPGVFPDSPDVYHVTFDSTNWNVPVLVTVHGVNVEDVHNTAIFQSIVNDPVNGDPDYNAAADLGDKRLDVQVFDNVNAGVFLLESGGKTLVAAGHTSTGP